jgi:hypothetical protein
LSVLAVAYQTLLIAIVYREVLEHPVQKIRTQDTQAALEVEV